MLTNNSEFLLYWKCAPSPSSEVVAVSKSLVAGLVLLVPLLAACSQNPTVVIGERGLLFAYIDMSSVDGAIQHAVFKSGADSRTRIQAYYAEGAIYSLNVPPGKYYLAEFTGSGGRHVIAETIAKPIDLTPSGMGYGGSYKYVRSKAKGLLSPGEFSLLPMGSPGEAEVLLILQRRFGDTAWGLKIKQQLQRLGREVK